MKNLLEFEEFSMLSEEVRDANGRPIKTGDMVKIKDMEYGRGKVKNIGIEFDKNNKDAGNNVHITLFLPHTQKDSVIIRKPSEIEVY